MKLKEAYSILKDAKELTEISGERHCDMCGEPAIIDGKTQMGPWGYMCKDHLNVAVGLGEGRGQLLVTKEIREELFERFKDLEGVDAKELVCIALVSR